MPHLRRARRLIAGELLETRDDIRFVLNINGERIKDIKKGFEAACAREALDGVTPHVLKHTAITWAMQNGADLWEASGFFATSLETLKRVYGHHHPDYMRGAADAVGRRPGGSRMGR